MRVLRPDSAGPRGAPENEGAAESANAVEWVFPGATPEHKQRALDAALAVFKAAGIDPEVAGFARMEMQVYLQRGERGQLPHKDSAKAALVFLDAQNAAIAASGAPPGDLDKGYIHVTFPDGSWAAYFMRESQVFNWVDPDEPRAVDLKFNTPS